MVAPRTLQQLWRLKEHTEPPLVPSRNPIGDHKATDEDKVRKRLANWGIPAPSLHEDVLAAMRSQIKNNRVTKTTTSRVVEAEICRVLTASSLPRVTMHMLFEKLCCLFESVAEARGSWLPAGIDLRKLRNLRETGNERQHFHALRLLLPPLRILLLRLAVSNQSSDRFLSHLGSLGVVNPNKVLFLVATAADDDVDEILSPPESLRKIWKPVARERMAPEDRTQAKIYTKHLWRTTMRVRDASMPRVSETEVKDAFGPDATLASHWHRRLPYESGANKYRLVENNPMVVENTARGLHMVSGPSGTAYRFLNLWLVLGGSEAELAVLRFAVAGLLMSGSHHSLIEVMVVCAPLMRCKPPADLVEMIDQLVPCELKTVWKGKSYSITPGVFQIELARRLEDLLA